jgi:transposase-like protein
MPWQEVTRVPLREEFVQLARQAGSNRRELCRRFGISPQDGKSRLTRGSHASGVHM